MKYFLQFGLIAFLFVFICLGMTNNAIAQESDTLDVEQGFETLNIAVEGDTLPDGSPKNVKRVYRLQRGGYYLLNGAVRGLSETPLRVVGADGDGPLPILVTAADESGSSDRLFRPNDDGEFKNLYMTSLDDLGIFTEDSKNTLRLEKDGGHFVLDNCYLDYQFQSYFRMNSDNQDLIITNCIFRNCGSLINPGDSKMIDTRGNHQDSIIIRNSTLFGASGRLIRSDAAPFNYLEIDHVTAMYFGEHIQMEKVLDAKITNNLFIDFRFEGRVMDMSDPSDTTDYEFVEIDTLGAPELRAEEDRHIVISNNVWGISPAFQTWYDSIDSLVAPVFIDQTGQHMINAFENMVAENNIFEVPEFSDAPAPDGILAYAQYRLEEPGDVENPDWYFDRNGRDALADDPYSFGLAEDEYDFDYSASAAAYTHAEGGLPAGDLNWFGLVSIGKSGKLVPGKFTLDQNYPNPFNPGTTISYTLDKGAIITLDIYNVLGQRVRTLVNNRVKTAGTHTAQWDGRDEAGLLVPSGMYFYRLNSGEQMQTRKMLMMK